MHVCNGKETKRRTKGEKSGSIHKNTDHKPGAAVSVDQLCIAHQLLVPQLSYKLTSVRIWYRQVMVDHISELTYVHLPRSTSQENNLA